MRGGACAWPAPISRSGTATRRSAPRHDHIYVRRARGNLPIHRWPVDRDRARQRTASSNRREKAGGQEAERMICTGRRGDPKVTGKYARTDFMWNAQAVAKPLGYFIAFAFAAVLSQGQLALAQQTRPAAQSADAPRGTAAPSGEASGRPNRPQNE